MPPGAAPQSQRALLLADPLDAARIAASHQAGPESALSALGALVGAGGELARGRFPRLELRAGMASARRFWSAVASGIPAGPFFYTVQIVQPARGKADSVASEALAGNYDQSASDLNDMSDYSTRAVAAISQAAARC